MESSAKYQRSENDEDKPCENYERQRRPANGFLGFCHKHREIVSKRNKKLENRLVTRILGQWWATLTTEEKAPYETKAKQSKDSFMAANPGFKWYTPRESTGRTPVTRLSNRRGRKLDSALTMPTLITPGKLADVSQMGGLNSLMSQPTDKKKMICEASYIANEHDYLLTSPNVNNNTIQVGDSASCTNGVCNVVDFSMGNGGPNTCNEEVTIKIEQSDDFDSFGIQTEIFKRSPSPELGAAKKRKFSKPRKNDTAAQNMPAEQTASFPHYLDSCPIYDYDLYLQRKADLSKKAKKSAAKRRKRQGAIARKTGSSVSSGSSGHGSMSLRHRKKGAYLISEDAIKLEVESDDEFPPGMEEEAGSPGQPRLGIELLLTAAESLEM